MSRINRNTFPSSLSSRSNKTTTKLIPATEPKNGTTRGPGRMPVYGQPMIARGSSRVPRTVGVPVAKKTSRLQCTAAAVTITEIDSIPHSSSTSIVSNANSSAVERRRSTQFLARPSSSRNIIATTNNEMTLQHFTDTESVFSTSTNASEEVTTIVPQTATNYVVMSSDHNDDDQNIQKEANNKGVSTKDEDSFSPVTKTLLKSLLQYAFDQSGWKLLPYVAVGGLLLYFILPVWSILSFLAFFYFSLQVIGGGSFTSRKKTSRRTIKWTIQEFSEEISNGFLTCPPFKDKSSQWRLVVSQKLMMDGVQTRFGLIATDIPRNLACVLANVKFSCTDNRGVELATGKFQHDFHRCGDLKFTQGVILSQRRLAEDDIVNILCRVEFQSVTISYWKMILRCIGVTPPQKGNCVKEIGIIQQEILVYQNAPKSKMEAFTRFVKHPDTKTFAWEIPNFAMLLRSREVWGIYSSQFFVNTEDFCAVWRMKLIEVSGVFRVHVQLRGLPKTLNQVRLWYLLQLVDTFGDSVVPEHSMSRIKYPDYIKLWDTSRHILYRRETLLSRFLGVDGSLTLRLSLQVKPNDVPLLETDSEEWLSPQE